MIIEKNPVYTGFFFVLESVKYHTLEVKVATAVILLHKS